MWHEGSWFPEGNPKGNPGLWMPCPHFSHRKEPEIIYSVSVGKQENLCTPYWGLEGNIPSAQGSSPLTPSPSKRWLWGRVFPWGTNSTELFSLGKAALPTVMKLILILMTSWEGFDLTYFSFLIFFFPQTDWSYRSETSWRPSELSLEDLQFRERCEQQKWNHRTWEGFWRIKTSTTAGQWLEVHFHCMDAESCWAHSRQVLV